MIRLALAIALTALAASPALADRATARSSGVQGVHTEPRLSSRIVDKLDDQERVYLTRCTKQSSWCRVQQLDGGPPGWVMGSYLIGWAAKTPVTPPEFSFDPMDPLGLFPNEDRHHPF